MERVATCWALFAMVLVVQVTEPVASSSQEKSALAPGIGALIRNGKKVRDAHLRDLISGSAVMDDLRQQMADFQAELNSTKDQLETTQTELKTTQTEIQEILQSTRADLETTKETLQSTQADLQTTQENLSSTQADLQTTQENLNSTQADLQTSLEKAKSTEEELQKTREQLQTAEQEIRSLKVEMDSAQSTHRHLSAKMGSTFIRWGRTTCPSNTTLVYSGYVGAPHWGHPGGGSNYLCLVRDPQLDNMTLPTDYNYLYGAEYRYIQGVHNQDAVCSVCRAPQTTTLMIPATLSCPPGWTTQYRGHLVAERFTHKGRTEFVCLDEVREYREGGEAYAAGAFFYHVITQCGSLPCPPYVNRKVVTCVVCSK